VVEVTHELTVDAECAYLISYGELNDGTDYADRAFANAERVWGDLLGKMHVDKEIPGYAPIYDCGYCGEQREGDGQHLAVVMQ
jgi:hypothetical protein